MLFSKPRVRKDVHAVEEVGGSLTVDGNGNAFKELETILAMKSRDLAKSADLKMFGDPRLVDDSKIEVICLCDH